MRIQLNRNFTLFLTATFVSAVGDWILFIAIPFYVYQLTGSVAATSLMFAAEMLPSLILGSVAGVFVDRWDRRATRVAADVMRAVLVTCLVVVQGADLLWLAYIVVAVESTIAQFSAPATAALLPALVAPHQLFRANSTGALRNQLSQVIGLPLGGALMAAFGFSTVVIADVATYLACAAILLLVRPTPGASFRPPATSERTSGLVESWLDGLRVLGGSGIVRAKAWKRGEPEPEAWTLEVPHKTAHQNGSPGLFGFSPQAERVYIDNVTVTAN